MIEIVNGYICMNCCDVDKARMGEDPHQSTNQIQKTLDRQFKLAPANFGPAVTFGGSLQANSSGTAGGTAGTPPALQNATAPVSSSGVDLVV